MVQKQFHKRVDLKRCYKVNFSQTYSIGLYFFQVWKRKCFVLLLTPLSMLLGILCVFHTNVLLCGIPVIKYNILSIIYRFVNACCIIYSNMSNNCINQLYTCFLNMYYNAYLIWTTNYFLDKCCRKLYGQ